MAKPRLNIIELGMGWFAQERGGLNRYVAGLHPRLRAEETDAHLIVAGEPTDAAGVAIAAPRGAGLPARWRGVRRAFDELGEPDLVASHFALYAFAVRKRLARLPHVVHFHGPWADESGVEGARRLAVWAKRRVESSVYKTGDRFITLSRAFAEILAQEYRINREKIRVIPGGVDTGRFNTQVSRGDARERLGWPRDRPIAICVRRLARRMGIERLINAVAKLQQRHPDLLVLVAGRGPLKSELCDRIEAAQLGQHMRLLGFVPEEDLPLAYRAADFSIVPTHLLEGFGLIVLESLAAGTPALVTPVGGLPEVIEGFSPQLILESVSDEAIANGLDAALAGTLQLPTSEECQAYVQEHFDWPSIAKRVLGVYQEARCCI